MTGSHRVAVFDWLAGIGVHVPESGWSIETGRAQGSVRGLAHASRTCPRSKIAFATTGVPQSFHDVAAQNDICEACLPQVLDKDLGPDAATQLFREIAMLQRSAKTIENAGSTFHVMIGEEYPALHAAIVHMIEPHLRRELAVRHDHPLYLQVREMVVAALDSLVAVHPYDPSSALDEAVLQAARWRFANFLPNDLFDRQLRDKYDAVQALARTLSRTVTRAGQARDVAARLLAENSELHAALPSLEEALSGWAELLDAALRDTAPTYFACGGLPRGFQSVPRTANGWMIWHGVRASHHHWGIGELPKVLLEYIAWCCRTSDMHGNVSVIDTPHVPLSEDAWQVAGALWKEHQNARRDEVPYADPGEAILAAASL